MSLLIRRGGVSVGGSAAAARGETPPLVKTSSQNVTGQEPEAITGSGR